MTSKFEQMTCEEKVRYGMKGFRGTICQRQIVHARPVPTCAVHHITPPLADSRGGSGTWPPGPFSVRSGDTLEWKQQPRPPRSTENVGELPAASDLTGLHTMDRGQLAFARSGETLSSGLRLCQSLELSASSLRLFLLFMFASRVQ